ncbi:isopentenyl-diphosphate delta-isomerase [Microbacteriaceae bacterium SG_E_30_P1]|uniref:Isopentenyl-diphosphate Delta-isomerase n=1 Tax=Antiquaquibacter oligotrophicus TaxID=2880260 RepID=A0ABT6KR51_9MICO|nr:isopentenyl-diphosphate Delta-isomerase [Antiquaquibacter oligotrophicus]MDH6182467.1 isopentenyl-diphosphate delta-isomerase [Antiquaquibacter oligotrophicus]UDF14562.1 isopentenyl-diphosphate Delta-isomerase [Antiquaquibacter oligotrophicus]
MSQPEQVVLLDESGEAIGVADKIAVHTTDTALHLAFSCHVYNEAGQVLVTRRALSKLTWPGVWTNSFCGHPAPGESFESAIARRAADELGITVSGVELILPDFRYRAVDASGIVENEVCPVYRAVTTSVVNPNPSEVAEFAWVDPDALATAAQAAPYAFSPWLGWQLTQLG